PSWKEDRSSDAGRPCSRASCPPLASSDAHRRRPEKVRAEALAHPELAAGRLAGLGQVGLPILQLQMTTRHQLFGEFRRLASELSRQLRRRKLVGVVPLLLPCVL